MSHGKTPEIGRNYTSVRIHSGRYDEQMIIHSNVSSQGSDPEASARDAQETSEDASMLKRFKIAHLVGTGNYARVYRAYSLAGKEVAVKSINLSKTSDNYRRKFLPRELTILKKVNHPSIVKIHEILQISDRVFIIMQFCSRGTIADLLHKLGPLGEAVTRDLFIQTIEAVSYLHSLDLAHRDLKVENILLDQNYCPKLTDFSYSVYTSDKHTFCRNAAKIVNLRLPVIKQLVPRSNSVRLNETFCGTLPYLSPEMIKQNPYDPKKTDVWSLGVCLFVMLNDRLPFPFSDIKMMIKKQIARDFKFRLGIEYSDNVKDLVNNMLDPDYVRRPTCLDVCKHVWLSGSRERPPG